jgi:hypothetical protein
MELVGRLAPSLNLGSGNVPEHGLLMLELFADSLEVGLDLRLEAVPLRFQLRLCGLPGSLARFSL